MRKPDWQSADGTIALHCCDCAEVLPDIQAGRDWAIVTDPPYGIALPCDYAARGRDGMAACIDWPDVQGDENEFDPRPLLQMNIPSVLWGANWYADKLPASGGWLVWDKLRGDELDQATCELAWTSCVKGVRRFVHRWDGFLRDSEREERYHPTQKPAALYLWTLGLRWLAPMTTIIDPYMGSGPCAVTCVKLGKRFIGCEIDESHFATSVRRIESAIASGGLFNGEMEKAIS